ncbi:MAG: sensor histidine kinase [Janthinobacterium lividum]
MTITAAHPAGAPPATPSTVLGHLRQCAAAAGYLLTGLPVAVLSFTLVVTGLSITAGIASSVLLIPFAALVLVATLAVARGFAHTDRWRLRWVGGDIEAPTRAGWRFENSPRDSKIRSLVRRWWAWVRDAQLWLDLLHAIVAFPLAVLTWSVAVTWIAGAFGGLTSWFWSRWVLVQGGQSLAGLLHVPFSETTLNLILGALFLLTLTPVLRGCALAHLGLGRALLGNQHLRALQQRVQHLTVSRVAAAEAEAQSLRTLERDLHDGPQQHLVRLDMDLATAERRLDDDPDAVRVLLAAARTQSAEALAELRSLSRGIAPPVLLDRGLEAALTGVVARCPIPATLHSSLDTDLAPTHAPVAGPARLPALVERTAYFVVTEALTNTAKHSGAASARVELSVRSGALLATIYDDGVGGAHTGKGHGLAGLASRVDAVDGTLTLDSPAGGPTVLTARLPLAG